MARILVIDDDPAIREMLEAVLGIEDHEVVTARNGKDGLAWLEIEPFDAILLDIMMPDLCGYEVLELVRANPARADTPVIVMSGRHDQDGLLREARSGAIDHLNKPFDTRELVGIVARVVGASPTSSRFASEMRTRSADVYASMLSLCEAARLDASEAAAG